MAAVSIWAQGGQSSNQEIIPLEFFEHYKVNYFHHPHFSGLGKRFQHHHHHHHHKNQQAQQPYDREQSL